VTPAAEPVGGRRRVPGLLVVLTAVVLVVAVVVAVVLTSSAGRPEIAAAPAPVEVNPVLKGVGTDAPAPTVPGLAGALAGVIANPALGTLTGTVVDPATGTTLWERNATGPLTPASTGKLLTAAAALLALDPQARLTTQVVAGPEPGSVVLVGGGDPTLNSLPDGKESVYPGAAHVDDLARQVLKANVGGPVRKVYVDLGRYRGDTLAPGWDPSDVGGGSVAPIVPVEVDGGRMDPLAPEGRRNGNPAQQVAAELARKLGAEPSAVALGSAPAGARVLGEVRSTPIPDLVDNFLTISDNVLAEAVARELARATGNEPSFAGGSRAVLDVLRRNGFDLTGVRMADGSGLSTQDLVPAKLLGSLLTVAAGSGDDPRTAKLRPLLDGLPIAGGSGTLADRYQTAPSSAGKGWVRAKTGTLSGVNTLAGTVLDDEGRLLVFALMSNNGAPSNDEVRGALDAIAATLRGCGCH
jgi:D-alanyl-D-alanine carboxypeptidase/D-alanyl-D-alanine-endopeptidase (penicillin-binding protein 4)